jgi:putative thioredoxin
MVPMTMPFSRPGAVDLSGLKRPSPAGAGQGRPASGSGRAAGAAGSATTGAAAYSFEVDEQNFQLLLEASMTAPVLLVVYSPSRVPVSADLADDLSLVAEELGGRIAVGRVDADAQPAIAQALRVQAVPLVVMLLQGQLQPLFQDAPQLEELRAMLPQLLEQLASQGLTGRHEPFSSGDAAVEGTAEEVADPRYAAAEAALVGGDLDTAVAEYEKLLAASPGDAEAALGLARTKLLQRTQDADLATARAAAAADPADVEAQLLVADLDLLGGHVDDAFDRLVALVKRTTAEERDQVRLRLIDLFAVVGNEDARVLRGRRELASALF